MGFGYINLLAAVKKPSISIYSGINRQTAKKKAGHPALPVMICHTCLANKVKQGLLANFCECLLGSFFICQLLLQFGNQRCHICIA